MQLMDQLKLLLGDVRGITWGHSARLDALAQAQLHLEQQDRIVERKSLLTLQAGVRAYALPAGHIQTFALLSGNYQVSLRLADANGIFWWLIVTPTGDLGFSSAMPVGEGLLGSVTRTSLRLVSADTTIWYLHPGLDGTPSVASVAPAGTVQTQLPQLRDAGGVPWYVGVTNVGDLLSTSTPSALPLTGNALAITPLQRQELAAFVHTNPSATPGIPRYYVTQGTTLLVSPVPSADVVCEHLYFAEDTLALPAQWQTPLAWEAAAWLMQRSWPLDAVAGMRGMAMAIRQRLIEAYVPGDRDAMETVQGRGV